MLMLSMTDDTFGRLQTDGKDEIQALLCKSRDERIVVICD